MKNKSYIGLGIIILVFGYWFLPKIFNRINTNQTIDSNRTMSIDQSSKLSFIKLNGSARKVPDFIFMNQDSLYIGNEDFLGKVYVAEFFFTSCPSICIEMNQNMKILDNEYGNREDFGIASFTIDPEYDTPHILKKYSESYNVKSQNWHFLTSNEKTVFNLANSGFNIFAAINPNVAGGFEHQGYFALIDKKGYLRSRVDNFDNPIVYYSGVDEGEDNKNDIDILIEDIAILLKE